MDIRKLFGSHKNSEDNSGDTPRWLVEVPAIALALLVLFIFVGGAIWLGSEPSQPAADPTQVTAEPTEYESNEDMKER